MLELGFFNFRTRWLGWVYVSGKVKHLTHTISFRPQNNSEIGIISILILQTRNGNSERLSNNLPGCKPRQCNSWALASSHYFILQCLLSLGMSWSIYSMAFSETFILNRYLRKQHFKGGSSAPFLQTLSKSWTGEGGYLNSQVTVLAGRGELLDVPVHLGHRQAAAALLPAADDIFEPRQHPLQLGVQVTAVICGWRWTRWVREAGRQWTLNMRLTMMNPSKENGTAMKLDISKFSAMQPNVTGCRHCFWGWEPMYSLR